MVEREVPFLKTAPRVLVWEYQSRSSFPGRDILYRLLTSDRMKRSWNELEKLIGNDTEWHDLWVEIKSAVYGMQRYQPSRTNEKNSYLKIASQANDLAAMISNGALDLRIHEYFPEDLMSILGVDGWSELDRRQRVAKAGELLESWPTILEVLVQLEERARVMADHAMNCPRIIDRRTRDSQSIYVVRSLGDFFQKRYQRRLYGTIANIASATLDIDIAKEFVEKKLKKKSP